MYKTLENQKRTSAIRFRQFCNLQGIEITSLDSIPDFDTPESEIHYWRMHRLSKELLDQLPDDDENQH
jgi:hypothetical protein